MSSLNHGACVSVVRFLTIRGAAESMAADKAVLRSSASLSREPL